MELILFETDRFNLSEEKDNFINPCCYGEDFANWLKSRLEASGIEVGDIYQEDWGWEISCHYQDDSYYLGLGSLPEEEGSDFGEWRVMFTKKRTILQSLLGQKKLAKDEPIISLVKDIVESDGIQNVAQETA